MEIFVTNCLHFRPSRWFYGWWWAIVFLFSKLHRCFLSFILHFVTQLFSIILKRNIYIYTLISRKKIHWFLFLPINTCLSLMANWLIHIFSDVVNNVSAIEYLIRLVSYLTADCCSRINDVCIICVVFVRNLKYWFNVYHWIVIVAFWFEEIISSWKEDCVE